MFRLHESLDNKTPASAAKVQSPSKSWEDVVEYSASHRTVVPKLESEKASRAPAQKVEVKPIKIRGPAKSVGMKSATATKGRTPKAKPVTPKRSKQSPVENTAPYHPFLTRRENRGRRGRQHGRVEDEPGGHGMRSQSWRLLAHFLPPHEGNARFEIQFPDGTTAYLGHWRNVLVYPVRWLYEHGHLHISDCPIVPPRSVTRRLMHSQPFHLDGRPFTNPIRVGDIYIETKDDRHQLVMKTKFVIQCLVPDLVRDFRIRSW